VVGIRRKGVKREAAMEKIGKEGAINKRGRSAK
jgi:hypothetical protein